MEKLTKAQMDKEIEKGLKAWEENTPEWEKKLAKKAAKAAVSFFNPSINDTETTTD